MNEEASTFPTDWLVVECVDDVPEKRKTLLNQERKTNTPAEMSKGTDPNVDSHHATEPYRTLGMP